MRNRWLWLLIWVILAGASATSCRVFRRGKPAPRPIILPAPSPAPEMPVEPEPLPPPPEVEAPSVGTVPPPPTEPVTPPPPPEQPKPAPSRRGRAAAVKPEPEETVPPAVPPAEVPAEVPQLTQLLTADQQRAYNREIDEAVRRTQDILRQLRSRHLNQEQAAALERVRSFLQQALATRNVDLVTARSLAQRADVLARDLVNSLQ